MLCDMTNYNFLSLVIADQEKKVGFFEHLGCLHFILNLHLGWKLLHRTVLNGIDAQT